jgi:small conductance mechanosensitive channel
MEDARAALNIDAAMTYLATVGIEAALNIALALVILIVGFMIAGAASRGVRKASERNSRIDPTLASFFASIVKYAILAVVIIAVLGRFGVQTTSLAAAFGAATLAIGLALQGTLSHVASGVMIVFFRPYKIGDFVEVAGVMGSVKDITLFYTELNTPDNKQIIVPNGQSWGGIITNFSAYPTRRVDITFSVSYDDDIDKAQQVIKDVFTADSRVHKDPEVFVEVIAHGASSIDLVTRAWVDAGDYWGVYFDAMKKVKQAFDANGVEIPYPHQVEIQKQG